MTQYNTFDVKLSNSQITKLKSAIINITKEANFPYNILLNDTQVSKIRKAFANVSLANIKFSRTELS